MRFYCLLLLCLLILPSCGYQHFRLLKKGKVKTKNYIEEIPINYEKGLLFLKVTIEGKNYNFIYDTGADVTVIDESIMPNIKHKKKYTRTVNDSSKRRRSLQYIELPSLKIGKIDFRKTGAAIGNLSVINEVLGCVHIDGIIGNNLMRKAVWQIDYAKEKLIFSDDVYQLNPAKDAFLYAMNARKIGPSRIRINIDGVASNFKLDTGFAGFIKAGKKVLDMLCKEVEGFDLVTLEGITGAGLFGKNKGQKQFGYAQKSTIGNLEMTGQVIEFRTKGNQLIGNYFFEHFTIITDWRNNKMYFDPIKPIEKDTMRGFPVRMISDYAKKEVVIGSKWLDHEQAPSIVTGTKVLQINEQLISALDKATLCEFMSSSMWKKDTIKLLLEGIAEPIIIQKQQLLPKR